MRLKTCCQKDAPHRIVGDADSGDDTDVIALVQCEPGELCGKSLLTRSRLHEDVSGFEQEIALIERHAGFFINFRAISGIPKGRLPWMTYDFRCER